MSLNLHTTRAMLDENGELRGLEKLESLRSQLVQVVIVSQPEAESDGSDLTPDQWNQMLMQSSAFKEWADPAEDIYTLEDGQPIEWDKGWATYRVGQSTNLKWNFVLLLYPFDGGGEAKMRPGLCLVDPIGPFSDVIMGYVSSQIPEQLEPPDLVLEPQDLSGTGLRKRSVLRLDRVFTADAMLMLRTLGQLPDALIPAVETRLRALFVL